MSSSTRLICRGTVEEGIDPLMESKRLLAGSSRGGGELLLTEMRDDALLKLVALNISAR